MTFNLSSLKVSKAFTILLTVLSITNLSFSVKILANDQPTPYSPKTCTNKSRKFFLPSPELSDSLPPKGEIKSICPGVQNACCSATEFNDLLSQLLQKQSLLEKTKSSLYKVVDWIVKLSDNEINDVTRLASEKKCISPEGTTLMSARSQLKKIHSKFENNTNSSFDFFFKKASGFSCSLCEENTTENFKMDSSEKGFNLEVDSDMCESVYTQGFEKGKMEIFLNLSYVNVFTEMLGCMAQEEISLFPVLDPKAFSQMQEKTLFCSSKNQWISNPECLDLCNSFPLINQNIFSEIMIPIQKTRIFMGNLMAEYHEQKDKLVQSSGQQIINNIKLETDLIKKVSNADLEQNVPSYMAKFKFFIEAIGGESENPKVMSVVLAENSGIKLNQWKTEFLLDEGVILAKTMIISIFVVLAFLKY